MTAETKDRMNREIAAALTAQGTGIVGLVFDAVLAAARVRGVI